MRFSPEVGQGVRWRSHSHGVGDVVSHRPKHTSFRKALATFRPFFSSRSLSLFDAKPFCTNNNKNFHLFHKASAAEYNAFKTENNPMPLSLSIAAHYGLQYYANFAPATHTQRTCKFHLFRNLTLVSVRWISSTKNCGPVYPIRSPLNPHCTITFHFSPNLMQNRRNCRSLRMLCVLSVGTAELIGNGLCLEAPEACVALPYSRTVGRIAVPMVCNNVLN